MKEKEFKGEIYRFRDILRLKHLKKLAQLSDKDPNPLTNSELLDYILDTFVIEPEFPDKDEMEAEVLVFIMKEIQSIQEPLTEMMADIQKKLPE